MSFSLGFWDYAGGLLRLGGVQSRFCLVRIGPMGGFNDVMALGRMGLGGKYSASGKLRVVGVAIGSVCDVTT